MIGVKSVLGSVIENVEGIIGGQIASVKEDVTEGVEGAIGRVRGVIRGVIEGVEGLIGGTKDIIRVPIVCVIEDMEGVEC